MDGKRYANNKCKKIGVFILISFKPDFETKKVSRDKHQTLTMIK